VKSGINIVILRNLDFLCVALATELILLIPAVAMQFSDDVNWDSTDFLVAGFLLRFVPGRVGQDDAAGGRGFCFLTLEHNLVPQRDDAGAGCFGLLRHRCSSMSSYKLSECERTTP
jgi:hypothetical protein